jgi:hypothetical protein
MCVHEITANENLEQAATNHNFVIHKASEMPGFPVHQIENMKFLATFLKKSEEPNKRERSIRMLRPMVFGRI